MDIVYLQGDEDCGISLQCRECDTGGKPFAYYPGVTDNPYDDVPTVTTLDGVMFAATQHILKLHSITRPEISVRTPWSSGPVPERPLFEIDPEELRADGVRGGIRYGG